MELNDLPVEILLHITQFLPLSDKAKVARLNSYFSHVVNPVLKQLHTQILVKHELEAMIHICRKDTAIYDKSKQLRYLLPVVY
jgi:hypothetical protein